MGEAGLQVLDFRRELVGCCGATSSASDGRRLPEGLNPPERLVSGVTTAMGRQFLAGNGHSAAHSARSLRFRFRLFFMSLIAILCVDSLSHFLSDFTDYNSIPEWYTYQCREFSQL